VARALHRQGREERSVVKLREGLIRLVSFLEQSN